MPVSAHARCLWSSTLGLLVSALALAACGGEGGGGGGGDGSTSIELGGSTMVFEALTYDEGPRSQRVTVTFSGDSLVWGTLPEHGGLLPSWLSLSHDEEPVSAGGARSLDFTLSVSPTDLTPGTRTFVLRFATGLGSAIDLGDASYTDLSIRYTVPGLTGPEERADATTSRSVEGQVRPGGGLAVIGSLDADARRGQAGKELSVEGQVRPGGG